MKNLFSPTQRRLVLAMQTPNLENGFYRWDDFVKQAGSDTALGFVSRAFLEQSDDWMHFIPYTVLRHTDEYGTSSYYTYQRTAKVGEQRLSGKFSIGVGGHVELLQCVIGTDTLLAAESCILDTAILELNEELVFGKDDEEQNVIDKERYFNECFVLIDRDHVDESGSNVGKHHIGIVHVVDVPFKDITTREEELRHVGFVNLPELQQLASNGSLERWSQQVVERLLIDSE